nr:FAD-dependent oxidoreductase [Microbacterium yannicii]
MTGAPEPLDELVAHARQTRVVVIGGGIAGLVAAWECAKVGMSVTVVEASDRLGGVIGSAEVAGLRLETGVTCWSTRGGVVRRLVEDVIPDAVIVRPREDQEWIAGLPRGAAAPLPREQVLSIPANPWDESVRRIIGWGGAWRAYVDRLRPPLTIGSQRSLGRLVRSRMGARVLDRLVAPIIVDRFGLDPDDVDVDLAAPGLNPALTRTGSLGGAVADLRLKAGSGPSIEGLDGGMLQLVDALREKLVERGARILTGTRVTALERADPHWAVELSVARGTAPAASRSANAQDPPLEQSGGREAGAQGAVPAAIDPAYPQELTPEQSGGREAGAQGAARAAIDPANPQPPTPEAGPLVADAVVIATDEGAARALLADLLGDLPGDRLESAAGDARAAATPAGIAREVVTLVVDAPELDAAPRGVHVHAVPSSTHRATGVAHETARWEWLARAAGPGRHVLRVAFGAPGAVPATQALGDTAAVALAAAEASALLGVDLDEGRVAGAHRELYALVPPASARGRLEAAAQTRDRISAAPAVAAVGAWLAGSGLAQVVADAQEQADRLRRAVLFGAGAGK